MKKIFLTLAIITATACAHKTAPDAPIDHAPASIAPTASLQLCWLSKKEITQFDLTNPRKYTRPPIIKTHEVSAIGFRMEQQQAVAIGIWLEKDDAAFETPVAAENRNDVTKQPIPVDKDGTYVLKIDSNKAKRTSDNTWIWQGEIQNAKKGKKFKQHVFLFCARES